MKKFVSFILMAIVAFSCCTARAGSDTAARKKLTLMIYICGSNLESSGGAATADITEMLRARFDREQVNVVIMAGGSKDWKSTISKDVTAIYEISGNRPKQVMTDGLLNMGEASTLETLLDYGYRNYPAEDYALILWDHGGGPLGGVCWDSLANSDNLTINELLDALDASPFAKEKLAWIGFDACLMASAEVAFALEPYAEYMIASEETEPGSGWNYEFLRDIAGDADGAATGERITETYASSLADSSSEYTLSCIDLGRVYDLDDALNAMFDGMPAELTGETFAMLSSMRRGSRGYGKADDDNNDYDLVDLYDLISHYSSYNPEAAQNAMDIIDKMVVANVSNTEGSHGISVYHPFYNRNYYEQKWAEDYPALYFNVSYTDYIQRFAEVLTGSSQTQWSKMLPLEEAGEEEGQLFTVQLNNEQVAEFAGAQLMILRRNIRNGKADTYSFLYSDDDVTLQDNGTLSIAYSGRNLCSLDTKGELSSDCVPFAINDKGQYIITFAAVDAKFERDSIQGYMLCELDEETDELIRLDYYVYDEDTQTYSNRGADSIWDMDEIWVPVRWYFETRDEEGVLLDFNQWMKDSNYLSWQGCSVEDFPLVKFVFKNRPMSGEELYASFRITDIRNHTRMTELMPFIDSAVNEIPADFETDIETEYISIEGIRLQVVDSPLSQQVRMFVEVTNKGDKPADISCDSIIINGETTIPYSQTASGSEYGCLNPSEKYTFNIFLSELYDTSAINSLRFSLKARVTDEDYLYYSQLLEYETVNTEVLLSADTGFMNTQTTQTEVLARGSFIKSGEYTLALELLELSVDENGSLSGKMRIINDTDTDVDNNFYDKFYVNGCSVKGFQMKISVKAGTSAIADFTTYNKIGISSAFYDCGAGTGFYLAEGYQMPSYRIDAIEKMDTEITYDNEKLELVFTDAFPVTYEHLDKGIVLFDTEEVRAELQGIIIIDKHPTLKVLLTNKTADTFVFGARDWYINGGDKETKTSIGLTDKGLAVNGNRTVVDYIMLENTAACESILSVSANFCLYDSNYAFSLYDEDIISELGNVKLMFSSPVPCYEKGGSNVPYEDIEIAVTETEVIKDADTGNEEKYFSYSLLDDGTAMLTGYSGKATDVIVPAVIDGHMVSEVDTDTFLYNNKITSVTFPEGISYIRGEALWKCSKLEKLVLPSTLGTFSVNSIAIQCPALNTIEISGQNDRLYTDNGVLYLETTKAKYLLLYPAGLDAAEFTIPDDVTEICGYAFNSCVNLQYITLPDGLTQLRNDTFSNCELLREIHIPDSVTVIGDDCFYYCKKLENVALPEQLTDIGEDAFYQCSNINSISIPAQVTSIGEGVFFMNHLESISVDPQNTSFTTDGIALYENATNSLIAYAGRSRTTEYEIPEGTKAIADWTIREGDYLRDLTIPASVTEIGRYAISEWDKYPIHVVEGSAADQYLREINYQNIVYIR